MEKTPVLIREYEEILKVLKESSRNKHEVLRFKISLYLSHFESLTVEQRFSWLFLELLIRVSEFLRIKSLYLLNLYQGDISEKIADENEIREVLKEVSSERNYTKNLCVNYRNLLPLGNILGERIFLPVISLEENEISKDLRLSFSKEDLVEEFVKGILRILKEEALQLEVIKKIPERSIEDYIEEILKRLNTKRSLYFRELLNLETDTFQLVYYFLALLFLCFYGECVLVQNKEDEDILVLKK